MRKKLLFCCLEIVDGADVGEDVGGGGDVGHDLVHGLGAQGVG